AKRIDALGLSGWAFKDGRDKNLWRERVKTAFALMEVVQGDIYAMDTLHAMNRNFPYHLPPGAVVRRQMDGKPDVTLATPLHIMPEDITDKDNVRVQNLDNWKKTYDPTIAQVIAQVENAKRDPRSVIAWGDEELSSFTREDGKSSKPMATF